MYSDEPVTIVEVGPRDGLQNEADFFPTADKIELINKLLVAGITRLEVTSFVHPKVIPQFKDALEVVNGIKVRPNVTYSAPVPNVKGCERALATPVITELALFVSASETHNLKNVNMTVQDSLAALREVAALAGGGGKRIRGYIVTAFGCPYEGRVPLEQVLMIAEEYERMGVSEISLGDTTGMANPRQVGEVFARVLKSCEGLSVAAHFHNSRGTGLANALAAYRTGVRVFDASVGGIGGCPTALGAMGNVATEDLVNMFEEMGVSTGISFERLIDAARYGEGVIGTELPSYTLKVGRPNWSGASV